MGRSAAATIAYGIKISDEGATKDKK